MRAIAWFLVCQFTWLRLRHSSGLFTCFKILSHSSLRDYFCSLCWHCCDSTTLLVICADSCVVQRSAYVCVSFFLDGMCVLARALSKYGACSLKIWDEVMLAPVLLTPRCWDRVKEKVLRASQQQLNDLISPDTVLWIHFKKKAFW